MALDHDNIMDAEAAFLFNHVGIVSCGLLQLLMIKVAIYFTCISPFLMIHIYFSIMLITLLLHLFLTLLLSLLSIFLHVYTAKANNSSFLWLRGIQVVVGTTFNSAAVAAAASTANMSLNLTHFATSISIFFFCLFLLAFQLSLCFELDWRSVLTYTC